MACEYHILTILKSQQSIKPDVFAKIGRKHFPATHIVHSLFLQWSISLDLSQYFLSPAHLLEQTKYYITSEVHRCPESTQVWLAVYPYCLFYLNNLLFGLLEIWNSVIWSALLLYWWIRTTTLSIILSCIQLLPGHLT